MVQIGHWRQDKIQKEPLVSHSLLANAFGKIINWSLIIEDSNPDKKEHWKLISV